MEVHKQAEQYAGEEPTCLHHLRPHGKVLNKDSMNGGAESHSA